MVPYVRASFRKHFINGMRYVENFDESKIELFNKEFNKPKEMSIEDENYKKYQKAYKYANDMTKEETYQAVEGMYHNLNSLQSRAGDQLPFTSINYGTCTFPEGRLVIKALLDTSIKGLGKMRRTAIFPD